jgi:hypothetical protein
MPRLDHCRERAGNLQGLRPTFFVAQSRGGVGRAGALLFSHSAKAASAQASRAAESGDLAYGSTPGR